MVHEKVLGNEVKDSSKRSAREVQKGRFKGGCRRQFKRRCMIGAKE